MNWKVTSVVGYILLFSISSPIGAQSITDKLSIADQLEQISSVSIFTTALKQSGLWAVVQNSESLSLFVPTDNALENENSAFLLQTVLLAPGNERRLVNSLSYHMVSSVNQVFRESGSGQQLTTLSGACLPVTTSGTVVKVGPEASVVDKISSVNGMIYIVDHLLWSPFEGSHCQSTIVSGL